MGDRSVPDYVTQNADGSVDVALLRGLDVDGARVMSVHLRESTVMDEEAAAKMGGKNDFATGMALMSILSEISAEDLRKLTSKDKKRIEVGLELVFFE